MSGFIHTKGSQWRKWDLHVHTPASFHWKGQRLATMTPTEKIDAFRLMLDTINNSDVDVFGIMDYWTFEGYLEFMSTIRSQGWVLNKTVLPGMELRIESPTNYRLNIHVILSNQLTDQQLIDFRSHLKLRLPDRQISNEALSALSDELGNDKKRAHGFDPDCMDDEARLLFGSMVAEVTKDSFVEAIKRVPNNKAFVLLPYDTSDGLSKLDWKSFPISDTFFLRFADIFETRKQETLDLFIGNCTPENEDFINDFQDALGGVHKPGIAGSDAHSFADYGVYPSNKITWIKADPNFNGLTQIIHEPETRVCISQNKPNPKTSYLVIDKVRFNDKRQVREFDDTWIELNEGLNVIIGGKSSGKSLLLHCVAKSIDPNQVNEKTTNRTYDFEHDLNFNFEVKWLDGSVNYLREDIESKSLHQISYIPQLYINHLADESGQENLREIVLGILLQNSTFKKKYNDQMDGITKHYTNIDKEIIALFTSKDELEKNKEHLSKMGNKESISIEIKKIEDEMDQLKINSGFSPEEETKYNDLIYKKNFHDAEINRLSSMSSALELFAKEIKSVTSNYATAMQNSIGQLRKQFQTDEKSSLVVNQLIKDLVEKLVPTLTEVSDFINYDSIDESLVLVSQLNEKITEELKPFVSKFANRTRLEELQLNIDAQKRILNNIFEQETRLSIETEKYNAQKKLILDEFKEMLHKYQLINDELSKPEFNTISDDMNLEANIIFDKAKFSKQFTDLFNRQKKLHKILPSCFDENDDLLFTNLETHSTLIEELFRNLLSNDELRLKGAYELKTVVRSLFSNYYYFDFNLIQKNDPFMHMSPGKRGLVLLQLFLHLSNSTHPILIDQPEDNLDNRTIYTELNEFIKNKKINRQIIIVTHNANLVVLTDAEQVIVANQTGQQNQRENQKYRFEYVSGSLECSFTHDETNGVLQRMGIKEHVCEILEGGKEAFEKREKKYNF
ncbi:TrlF family AAA-like ATPase [Paenibacillus sp. BGI2013]|uniref:TrlF family AAA-like ATPase n=1 Tax=Paenibacillus sp. BGI2013 TaxID=2058902 RepID=UPI00117F6480|nr:hypothetical protein [Paenibacillus sp. BGI2013]